MMVVSKEEVLRRDCSLAEASIEHRLAELVRYGVSLRDLSSDEERGAAMTRDNALAVFEVGFGIHGYGQDSRELWDIPEVKAWAEAWVARQPYAPMFLSREGLTLLLLLILGNRGVGNTPMPNVESPALGGFLSHVDEGFARLLTKYSAVYPMLPFISFRRTMIRGATTSLQKSSRHWWKF